MRPRKVPPVHVPEGHKFCFRCETVLPRLSFSRDARNWDGRRCDCRTCDSRAAAARDQRRRAFRNTVLASRWGVR